MQTTVAAGTFNAQSVGYVQGEFLPDPAVMWQMAGGVLAESETLPMWGGVAINETVTPNGAGGPDGVLGGFITRATSAAQITGFSVFNQNYAAAITPQNPVPVSGSGGQVNFFRLGTNARIVVACDPALADLETGSINQQVSWDFVNQQLIPYVAAYPANVLTAASWANTNGGEVTFTTTTAHGVGVGDVFVIEDTTPAGYNGTYTAITGTAGETLVAELASNPGAESALGTLVAGGGALPCKVLSIETGNSMVVSYDRSTGLTTWNYQGTVAVILI
jgi:hypothetical protein